MEGRSTRVTYTIYSNGIYVDEIRASFDINKGRGAQDYGSIVILLQTRDVSENTIKVTISFNSTANEPRTKTDSFEFHIDSVVVTNNYRLTALIVLLFASVVFIMSRKGWGAGP